MAEPGLVRSLFTGRLRAELLFPFPRPDAETRETADEIATMVADWAAEAIDPAAIDERKEIPREVIDGMAELGLFGLTIPEEYGGAGMGPWTYARVMEALAHRCASTVTILGGHLGLGSKGILLYGTDEQKAHWLPKVASGERIGAFALTEAGAGSDAANQRTTADRTDDGGWVLNGRKTWITNGSFAGFFTVFARTPHPTEPDAPLKRRPISAFVVARDTTGIDVGAPEDKMGLRGSSTTEIGFENVVLPADALLGAEGEGFKVALNVLNAGRHGLAACCIGQAKLARELAVAHATEREQFGKPIASFGMVQELLAGIDADIYAMEAGTRLAAGMMHSGEPDTMLEAACMKMFATESLWRIANDSLQVSGGTGFMREYPYERIVRDARINMIFEGTNQILRMMLATQGARPFVRGEVQRTADAPVLDGIPPELADEARVVLEQIPAFASSVEGAVEAHGKALRDAQPTVRRLADAATGLYGQLACLARYTAAATDGADDLDAERARARLACRRLARATRTAILEHDDPDDALVGEVAGQMTGLG